MDRRDLLKVGLAAPFILTSSMASGSGGGPDVKLKFMQLGYYDGDDGDEVKITNLYINYKSNYFGVSLTNYQLIDDANADGKQTATNALKGSRRIGQVRPYYENGFAGGFKSGLYTNANAIPEGRNAPVLIQVHYKRNPFTLSGSIRFKPLNARRIKKLAKPAELRNEPVIADLKLNGNWLIIKPKNNRFGNRLHLGKY